MAAVAQQVGALAVAYRSSRRSDRLLLEAASAAGSLGLDLAVVVPFVIPADGPGCCGLRGQRWREMLLEVAEEDAQRARRLLAETDVTHAVTVAEGCSLPEIVSDFSAEGDRKLALPKKASGTAFSRTELQRIRRRGDVPVHLL